MTILYFAALRDLVGLDSEELTRPADVTTIGEFSRWIQRHHPALDGRLGTVRFARNEQFADEQETIDNSDRIALIPPVAGG